MDFHKISVRFYCLFLVSFPVSITISQTFAILSTFSFLIDSWKKNTIGRRLRNSFFLVSLLVYISLLPSLFVNSSSSSFFWKALTKEEISDFWMCFVLLTGHFLSRREENLKLFTRFFGYSTLILLITGLVSLFIPFRLAVFLQNGFQVPEGARMQHFAGEVWGIPTYLPIGMMNTHLSFGGLLGLSFVGLFSHFLYYIRKRSILKNILYGFYLSLFVLVLFYNQSRSIWFGIIFSYIIFSLRFFDVWKSLITKTRGIILVFILILLTLSGSFLFQKNWLVQRAFKESLQENTTENQRYFIYKNTLSLISDRFLLGVGPGNFPTAHMEKSGNMIESKEELWYELFITPRGHAHHDLLHFFSIGGIISAFSYAFFWIYSLRFFYTIQVRGAELLFSGFLTLLPAGFFQCYFLDDEVVLPFYVLLGVFSGRSYAIAEEIREKNKIFRLLQERKRKAGQTFHVETISLQNTLEAFSNWFKKINIKDGVQSFTKNPLQNAILAFTFPMLLSFVYIFKLTSYPIEEVYKRKIITKFPEDRISIQKSLFSTQEKLDSAHAKEGFMVEGCLTHRFGYPPKLRPEPFIIGLTIASGLTNPPSEVEIVVYERDSFDQDQMYKAHSKKEILRKKILLNQGENWIEFPEIVSLGVSPKMPENIYFRDFEFFYKPTHPEQQLLNLPKINFGKLCGLR
jgi:O-antigen ligase